MYKCITVYDYVLCTQNCKEEERDQANQDSARMFAQEIRKIKRGKKPPQPCLTRQSWVVCSTPFTKLHPARGDKWSFAGQLGCNNAPNEKALSSTNSKNRGQWRIVLICDSYAVLVLRICGSAERNDPTTGNFRAANVLSVLTSALPRMETTPSRTGGVERRTTTYGVLRTCLTVSVRHSVNVLGLVVCALCFARTYSVENSSDHMRLRLQKKKTRTERNPGQSATSGK